MENRYRKNRDYSFYIMSVKFNNLNIKHGQKIESKIGIGY